MFSANIAFKEINSKFHGVEMTPGQLRNELASVCRPYYRTLPPSYTVDHLISYGVSEGWLLEQPGGVYRVANSSNGLLTVR